MSFYKLWEKSLNNKEISNEYFISFLYSSVDSYFNDLYAIQDKVYKIINKKPTIIRFPEGSSNTVSNFNKGIMTILTNEVLNRGYHYFDWNFVQKFAFRHLHYFYVFPVDLYYFDFPS